jgi:hypothetical protein
MIRREATPPHSPRWRIGSTRWRLSAPSLGGGDERASQAENIVANAVITAEAARTITDHSM